MIQNTGKSIERCRNPFSFRMIDLMTMSVSMLVIAHLSKVLQFAEGVFDFVECTWIIASFSPRYSTSLL